MIDIFKNITCENIDDEHICCAISDPKHKCGVSAKKEWLKQRLCEGHVFRKLDDRGKVFIEYTPLEKAWVPVVAQNYMHIYCLWVSGSFKGKGYGKQLLDYCIEDAKKQGKSGISVLSAKKKKPYLMEKPFLQKYGFKVVDEIQDYQLLALSFDGTNPQFSDTAKAQAIEQKGLVIYYDAQCPFTLDSVKQTQNYCEKNDIPLKLILIDSLEKAKTLPCVFNNWAVFYNGKFQSLTLLNETGVKKIVG